MTRVLSALAGIPLVVAAVYLSGPPLYRVLAAALAALALAEFLGMCGVAGILRIAALAGGAAAAGTAGADHGPLVAGAALLSIMAASIAGAGDPSRRFREASETVLGTVYVAYAFAALVLLRDLPDGSSWTMVLLGVLWAGDTAAFYGGTLTGRRKLAPSLSPKKTWEGAAWGLAGSAAAGALLASLLVPGAGPGGGAFLGLLVGGSGQAGDLVESLWKRAKGVKDSGRLIPGHGGLLDRVDSLLMGVPVGYNLLKYWEM